MEFVISALELVYRFFAAAVGMLPFEWANHEFMRTPVLMLLVISPLSASVGTIVVNAKMSFYTSAIGHSAFTGVAIGILFGFVQPSAMTFTLVIFGVLLAMIMTHFASRSSVSLDSLVGVVSTLAVAVGIVVITSFKFQRTERFLFGDILFATKSNLAVMFVLFLAVSAFLAFAYNRLLMIGLSRNLARAWGVQVFLYEYAFAVTVAVVVMMSINTVGVLLVTALIIIPAAAGRNFAWNAGSMFIMSNVIALASGIVGLTLSWRWSSATGATVVTVSGVAFVLSLIYFEIKQRYLKVWR